VRKLKPRSVSNNHYDEQPGTSPSTLERSITSLSDMQQSTANTQRTELSVSSEHSTEIVPQLDSGDANREQQPPLGPLHLQSQLTRTEATALLEPTKDVSLPHPALQPLPFPEDAQSSYRLPRQKHISGCSNYTTGPWSELEQRQFLQGLLCYGWGQWKEIGTVLCSRYVEKASVRCAVPSFTFAMRTSRPCKQRQLTPLPLLIIPYRSNCQIKSHGQKLATKWKAGENIFKPLTDADMELLTASLTNNVLATVASESSQQQQQSVHPPDNESSDRQSCAAPESQLNPPVQSTHAREKTTELMNAAYILYAMKMHKTSTLATRSSSSEVDS
jgi:hypothetical protein